MPAVYRLLASVPRTTRAAIRRWSERAVVPVRGWVRAPRCSRPDWRWSRRWRSWRPCRASAARRCSPGDRAASTRSPGRRRPTRETSRTPAAPTDCSRTFCTSARTHAGACTTSTSTRRPSARHAVDTLQYRYGYINDNLTLSGLLDKADCDLFSNMCRPKHCIHHVLPPLRVVDNLRVRGHVYNLP